MHFSPFSSVYSEHHTLNHANNHNRTKTPIKVLICCLFDCFNKPAFRSPALKYKLGAPHLQ